jgi:hypothetical protein
VAKETSDPDKWTTYTNTYYFVGTDVICTPELDCTLSPAATASLPDGNYRWSIQAYFPDYLGPWTAYMYFTLP